jgi:hypothetical protein
MTGMNAVARIFPMEKDLFLVFVSQLELVIKKEECVLKKNKLLNTLKIIIRIPIV